MTFFLCTALFRQGLSVDFVDRFPQFDGVAGGDDECLETISFMQHALRVIVHDRVF
jgi:hypothetical protein